MSENGYHVHDGEVETLTSETELKLRGAITEVATSIESWRNDRTPLHEYLRLQARKKEAAKS